METNPNLKEMRERGEGMDEPNVGLETIIISSGLCANLKLATNCGMEYLNILPIYYFNNKPSAF
jgi:hypothetical protein